MGTIQAKNFQSINQEASEWLVKFESYIPSEKLDDPVLFFSQTDEKFAQWVSQSVEYRVTFLRLYTAWLHSDRLKAMPLLVPSAYQKSVEFIKARKFLMTSIAACFLLITFTLLNFITKPQIETFSTLVGGFQSVPLNDGSVLELNTNTRLMTEITESSRKVTLKKGEAYFDIAHDKDRPFIVDVGDKRITVLGTKFSVKYEGKDVEVIVSEGRVRVDHVNKAEPKTIFVEKNMVALASNDAVVVTEKELEQTQADLSWREGLLVFKQDSLANIVKEFNRYNRKKIIIKDQAASEVRLGGSFHANNIDAFVRLLENALGLNVKYKKNTVIIL